MVFKLLASRKLNVDPIVHFNQENIDLQITKQSFVSCISMWHMKFTVNRLYPFLYMKNE